MKHPVLARNPRVAATVAALDGGLNAAASARAIADTQLTECRNMEWRDGMLRTRRGFHTDAQSMAPIGVSEHTQFFVDRNRWTVMVSYGDGEASGFLNVQTFDPDGHVGAVLLDEQGARGKHGFAVEAGGKWAIPYSCLLYTNDGRVFGIHPAAGLMEELTRFAYVPLYRLNGTPTAEKVGGESGERGEAQNRLNGQLRCAYTADGVGTYYPLPKTAQTVHSISVNGSSYPLDVSFGGITARADLTIPCAWLEQNGKPYAVQKSEANNVEVVFTGGEPLQTPMSFSQAIWFGGDRQTGGARLFFRGDVGYVMWSAPDDPLYVPYTAFAAVGVTGEPITAFGKQGDYLVLFKQRELFALEYVADSTAQTYDVTATAQFAIRPLHSEIGCDLPHTVALCGNCLMWACRDGSLYRLETLNRLQQQRVTRLGEEIRPLLQAASPDGVSATVTDGRYRLLWGDTLYTASDDTVPRWTSATFDATRTTPRRVCRVGEELRVAGAYTVSGVAFLVWLRLTGERDSEVSHTGDSWMDATFSTTDVLVTGSLCTKQFAFGSAEEYKQITRVFAEAEADGVALATYLTERGRQTELPCFVEDGLELTPGGLRCRYFALRLEGEGLRVGGITVHLIGGQR